MEALFPRRVSCPTQSGYPVFGVFLFLLLGWGIQYSLKPLIYLCALSR